MRRADANARKLRLRAGPKVRFTASPVNHHGRLELPPNEPAHLRLWDNPLFPTYTTSQRMASLKSSLSFLAEHEILLMALLDAPDGLTQGELAARGITTRNADSSLTPVVLQRLLDLGILEERPGESVYLELNLAVRSFLGHLLRTHELITPEAIRGYVTELEGQGRALADAASNADAQSAVLALERLAAAIERVRSYANANHAAILQRVLRAKAGADGYSVRERYLRINALWQDYLGPLRALVEPGEWAHSSFDRLSELLSHAREAFIAHGVVADGCERVRARLLRMRTQAGACYAEAYRELLPLYERARRQNLIAEGCGRWLEHLSRHSAGRLASALPVARVSWQGQFNDAALTARLLALVKFDPVAPPPMSEEISGRPDVVSITRLRAALTLARPIGDLLAWLAEQLPHASRAELVRAYVALSPNAIANADQPEQRWLLRPEGQIGYRPLAIGS